MIIATINILVSALQYSVAKVFPVCVTSVTVGSDLNVAISIPANLQTSRAIPEETVFGLTLSDIEKGSSIGEIFQGGELQTMMMRDGYLLKPFGPNLLATEARSKRGRYYIYARNRKRSQPALLITTDAKWKKSRKDLP